MPGGWIEARETAAGRTTAPSGEMRLIRPGAGFCRASSRAARAPSSGQSVLPVPADRRARRPVRRGAGRDAWRRSGRRAMGGGGRGIRLGDAGKQDARGGVCGDSGGGGRSTSSGDAAADRRAAGSRCAGGRHAWRRFAWQRRPRGEIGWRHHDGDAEAAQEGLRGRGLRPGFARGRQGHDQTTRGRDDQPPRGGFGRTQQPQYGEPEMAGQGGVGSPPPWGRSAVVRPPGGGICSVATPTRRFASTSPQGGGERQPASPAMATRPARMRFSASRLLCIAAVPSIAASFQGGGIIARVGGAWINIRTEIVNVDG